MDRWAVILGLCVGLAALAAAIKALPVIWGFVKAVCRAPLVIEAVAKEFSPNGGNSLRDSINNLSDQVSDHANQDIKIQEDLAKRIDDLFQAVLNGTVERTSK